MSIANKFYLLQYKHWKLQFRKKLVTAVELLIPVVLCGVMILVRSIVEVTDHPFPTTFPSHKIDTFTPKLLSSFDSRLRVVGLAYTPKAALTDQIMLGVRDQLQRRLTKFILMDAFNTEEEMVDFLLFSNTSLNQELYYIGGVVFDNPRAYETAIPHNISYSIRCKYNLRTSKTIGLHWQTGLVYPWFIIPGIQGDNFSTDPNYYEEGFLQIQHALHQSVIGILNPNSNISAVSTAMERFPFPPHIDDLFLLIIQRSFSFFIMLCMIFFSLHIPKEITLEKEKKLKESMKMMGMSNWLQWTAAFTKYCLFLLIVTFLMALLLCPPFDIPPRFFVFSKSSFSVIWLYFFLYAVSTITFGFMVSVFFNKANSSAAAGGIVFFASFIPYYLIYQSYSTLSKWMKLLAALNLNIAMPMGMLMIGSYEGAGVGVHWNNLYQPVSIDDDLSFGELLAMLAVDSLLHFLIMWYVEAVFPGTYGIPQSPYFFVLPSYWCGTKQNSPGRGQAFHKSRVAIEETKAKSFEFIENDPINLDAGILLKGLTKKFKTKGTEKVAVNKLNLNMYEGQITALLGHNGAGKTTTMFMLTGFLPPTNGTAIVNGYDIRDDITGVRSSLGLCPQHDILFDNLTVEEHLYFFAKLKGCANEKIKSEIDYYIKSLGLEGKEKAFSSTLSGGQKRKLSVGIALIGDSKIVILDEPTSGMDPSARRHMWDVLQEQRAGRTILLSTHFMDEADHLGDRIAIMADGAVQCCGSSLFLKKKYGAGYHMVMTKTQDCDVSKVHELLTRHVPEAKLESNVGAELSYILPDAKVSAFPEMFSELEQTKDSLGILGFGASVTTMEEVFMRVGEGQVSEKGTLETEKGTGNSAFNEIDSIVDDDGVSRIDLDRKSAKPADLAQVAHDVKKNTGLALVAQQYKAMLLKRIIYTLRNKALTISQVMLPLIFTAMTVAVLKARPTNSGIAVKRSLNLDMFGETGALYTRGLATENNISKAFSSLFTSSQSHTVEKVDHDLRGEIIAISERSMMTYKFHTVVAVDYDQTRNNISDVTVLFNPTSYHGAATALLYSDLALLHHFVNDSYTFTAANHPLPQSTNAEIESKANQVLNLDSFSYSANMMFGFAFVAASFSYFLIYERTRKVKHSQTVSGVKWYNFWFSTFVWDFISYLIPTLAVLGLFAIAEIKNMADITEGFMQPLIVLALLVMYGICFLPMMYAMQFVFNGPATGYVILVFFNMLTGIFPQLVVTALTLIESTREESKLLDWAFITFLPNYNMGMGIGVIFANYDYVDLCIHQLPANFNMTPDKESLDSICKTIKEDFNRSFPCCKGKILQTLTTKNVSVVVVGKTVPV